MMGTMSGQGRRYGSMMVADMAAFYTAKQDAADALESLFEKYGRFCEETVNLVMPG
jgi:phosphoglucomutase